VVEAYPDKPHLELMKAQDDDALRDFIRKFGPLRLSDSDSVAWYRAKRDYLVAVARLLESIGLGPEDRREAFAALLEASKREDLVNGFTPRRWQLYIPSTTDAFTTEEMQKWCEVANPNEIERACAYFIECSAVPMPSYRVVKKGPRKVVRASFFVNNLWEALVLMLWLDISREDPIQFCRNKNCGKPIVCKTQHARKFCDPICAKRDADRNWAKKKRAKKKKKRIRQR
jgi:hypothetical protein